MKYLYEALDEYVVGEPKRRKMKFFRSENSKTPTATTEASPPPQAHLINARQFKFELIMVVDYGGSIFPIIAHSPWNGLHLPDFVMPFFFFVARTDLAITYKKVPERKEAIMNVASRALKLFLVGILREV